MITRSDQQILELMEPYPLKVCLLCGGRKNKGYLTCKDWHCTRVCPDRYGCKGGKKDRRGHTRPGKKNLSQEMCCHCSRFLENNIPDASAYYVYFTQKPYVGMTYHPEGRNKEHGDKRSERIIWLSPPIGNKVDAFRKEWALRCMLDYAIAFDKFFVQRIEQITSFRLPTDEMNLDEPDMHEILGKAPGLFWDRNNVE